MICHKITPSQFFYHLQLEARNSFSKPYQFDVNIGKTTLESQQYMYSATS